VFRGAKRKNISGAARRRLACIINFNGELNFDFCLCQMSRAGRQTPGATRIKRMEGEGRGVWNRSTGTEEVGCLFQGYCAFQCPAHEQVACQGQQQKKRQTKLNKPGKATRNRCLRTLRIHLSIFLQFWHAPACPSVPIFGSINRFAQLCARIIRGTRPRATLPSVKQVFGHEKRAGQHDRTFHYPSCFGPEVITIKTHYQEQLHRTTTQQENQTEPEHAEKEQDTPWEVFRTGSRRK